MRAVNYLSVHLGLRGHVIAYNKLSCSISSWKLHTMEILLWIKMTIRHTRVNTLRLRQRQLNCFSDELQECIETPGDLGI